MKSLTLPFKEFEFRKDSRAEAPPDASQTNSAQTQLDVSDICELASEAGAFVMPSDSLGLRI